MMRERTLAVFATVGVLCDASSPEERVTWLTAERGKAVSGRPGLSVNSRTLLQSEAARFSASFQRANDQQ